MIANISGDDNHIFDELSYAVNSCITEQPDTFLKKENGLSVEHILILLELIRQYGNSENAGKKSKHCALQLSEKIKEVTKSIAFDQDKIIYKCIEDYLFILSESEKIQPTNEIYDEAINAFLYRTPDPFTREVNALNKQKIMLYKVIAAKSRIKDQQRDTLGPRKQLSMNYHPEEVNILDDEIYKLNQKINLIDEEIQSVKSDVKSKEQYNGIYYFIEKLYNMKINNGIMQDFGNEVLLSKNKSEVNETGYNISRAKSRHIQELFYQSEL